MKLRSSLKMFVYKRRLIKLILKNIGMQGSESTVKFLNVSSPYKGPSGFLIWKNLLIIAELITKTFI
jgi:ribosomal protein L10